ncbi:MAG: hypothetical protein R3F55_11510 [Alphaproteobacteria bacterium]
MALRIETFDNATGGSSFFKAVGHPYTAERLQALLAGLHGRRVALYDPDGLAAPLAELFDIAALDPVAVYVQAVTAVGTPVLGCSAEPVTALADARIDALLLPAFDAGRLVDHIRHLVPAGCEVVTLDRVRLPDSLLSNPRRYLDGLNFATNFAFFRDGDGHHTRVATCNYWSGYGAPDVRLWLRLFDADGRTLAEWEQPVAGNGAAIVLDSADVRARFGLPAFCGQLFIHVVGAHGHDVVKYALDTYGDDDAVLSCTHDANAWPADYYAGLPAPRDGERVVLWVQNSHPCPIPAGAVRLNRMGRAEEAAFDRAVPAYGTAPLDVADLLPGLRWPEQVEITAGRHFVRPRYEVLEDAGPDGVGRQRIAHPNVQRIDLKPDPKIRELANLLGKGHLLPAPVLPVDRFRSIALPTPMARGQADLPLAAILYDRDGREVGRRAFGRLPRDHAAALDAAELLDSRALPGGYGHMELVYDFADGGGADGWLHGLFRYHDAATGHTAETSFGGHVFNTVLTYRGEPQSYAGRPPGLSTRLFLRVGAPPLDTLCQLIYPASTPWHATSDTTLTLHAADGRPVAEKRIAIACSGSLLWRMSEMFDDDARAAAHAAGPGTYVLIRDTTCRLFGYHGLTSARAFSLDHMFGF